MFEIGSVIVPHTFGEKEIIILRDGVEVFRFEPDTVRWMRGLGIDPVEELTAMMIYELKDDSVREEIFELLKENLKSSYTNTK
jgi:mannitol/fructose-specific phosphotransferase system IIA component